MSLNVLTGETLDATEEKRLVTAAKAAVDCLWDADIKTLHKEHRMPLEVNVGPTRAVANVLLSDPKLERQAQNMAGPMTRYAAQMLNLPDTADFELRVYSHSQYLCIEIPRLHTWTPTFPEIERLAAEQLLVGFDAVTAELATFDLAADRAAPGAFLAANPGGGKTNMLVMLMAQLLRLGWDVWLVDLKRGRDFRELGILPHLHRIAFTNNDAAELLGDLQEEMEERNWGRRPVEPFIVLVIDEIRRLSDDNQETVLDLVTSGRSVGIRHLYATQHILEIDTKIAKTFDVRFAGQVADADESYYASGRKQLRAHEVLREPGEFFYVRKWARTQHVKVPLADERQYVGHVYEGLPVYPNNGMEVSVVSPKRQADAAGKQRGAQTDYIERMVPDGPVDLTNYWLPRTSRQIRTILQHEAEKAGDGRKVPSLELIEWAADYMKAHDKLPSFHSLRAAAQEFDDTPYTDTRRREIRYLVATMQRRFDLAADA